MPDELLQLFNGIKHPKTVRVSLGSANRKKSQIAETRSGEIADDLRSKTDKIGLVFPLLRASAIGSAPSRKGKERHAG
jgi:hypothetical protein